MRKATPVYIIAAGAVCIFLGIVYLGNVKSPPAGVGPSSLAGTAAQSFDVPALSGRTESLQAYRGHIVFLNLWASWCPPCRAEMPDLQRFYRAYQQRNVVVIGANQGESADQARAFATALGIHFPIWIDQGQNYGRVYAALGMPTTIVIDVQGNVVRGFDGALTFDQMVAAVKPLLGKDRTH